MLHVYTPSKPGHTPGQWQILGCTLRWVHHEFNSSNDDSWYINIIIVSQFTNSVSELSFANSNQMLTMFYCMYIHHVASLALIVRLVFQRRPQTFSTLPRFKIKEAFSFEKASQQYQRSALLKAEGKVGNNLPGYKEWKQKKCPPLNF